jgi:hypothetical protein
MKGLVSAAGLFAALMISAVPSSARAATCDRTCMDGMLGQFISAVVAKSPARVPVAIGFRETENSVLAPAGTGPWQTVTAVGPVHRHYLDPVTGNAVFFGVVTDRGEPADARRRNHFMEVFGIDGGKIRTVHAAMLYADPHLPLPNWAPYEGKFPVVVNTNPR